MNERVYLDHAASTPALPEVVEAMAAWWLRPGNPSSGHTHGRAARAAVERARADVARLVGCSPKAVVFTSGATEANHLGIRAGRPSRVSVGAGEHPSAREAARAADPNLRVWPLDGSGRVVIQDDDSNLVAVQAVNHETGVIQPIAAIAASVHGRGAQLHVDAAQAVGRMDLSLLGFDRLALSGHKIGGPTGIGALVAHDADHLTALTTGGGQERGVRAGTVPTALCVGLGVAAALALSERSNRVARLAELDAELFRVVSTRGGRILGAGAERVAGLLAAVFVGWRGDVLAAALDLEGVSVSAGAACASGSARPSEVLLAMGDPDPAGIVRISLGACSTAQDLVRLGDALSNILARRPHSRSQIG